MLDIGCGYKRNNKLMGKWPDAGAKNTFNAIFADGILLTTGKILHRLLIRYNDCLFFR